MKNLSKHLLRYKNLILILVLGITIGNGFLLTKVGTNYNLEDYLPKDVPSIIASEELLQDYDLKIPNVKLVLSDVTINEVIGYKKKVLAIKGVNQVLWLDDFIDLENLDYSGLSLDTSVLNDWYYNQKALLLINIEDNNTIKIIKDIKEAVKSDSLITGHAVIKAVSQENVTGEIKNIILFVVPIIFLILLITTSSWLEPILFLITILVAIIINLGTNIIFKEISFITQSAVIVLQLAVSMDYAIFLLHRFTSIREEKEEVETSMRRAMSDSAPVILGSALTTILGFLALTIMKFKIGADLGLVLAKGITLSFLSVMILLPILAVLMHKVIEKTKHKSLIPSFNKVGKLIVKSRYLVLIIVLLLVVPSYLGSQKNNFLYGSSAMEDENSSAYKDNLKINEMFGNDNNIMILVPKGDFKKEEKIIAKLLDLNPNLTINSYITTFGTEVPMEYLPEKIVKQFISKKYSKIIIQTDLEEEGKETFDFLESMDKILKKEYEQYYVAGVSPTNYDMMKVITEDNLKVNLVAIISIFLVLVLIFKSLFTPLILITTIEIAIWINLFITYLYGLPLNYIGFLIVSIVQLGATVDYAILFAKRYIENRKDKERKESLIFTIEETAPSILSSALILGIAGFGLGIISSNNVISQLGTLVGRGALISAIMVLLFLPAMFSISDKWIKK
ncbi:MAG: efflux RND transporter permease subunit [Bacilli bacterium]